MSNGAGQPAAPAAHESVRCLGIPVGSEVLLLPHTAVAEIGGYEPPTPVPHAPRWLLGMVRWRGLSVPLIAFEPLLGGSADGKKAPARVAILNSLGGDPRLPFMAIAATAIPRLTVAEASAVAPLEAAADESGAVLQRVRLAGSAFVIPDLDALERMLLGLGL